jgi:hypothetical protein
MYIVFAGSSDKMPFRVMTNETAYFGLCTPSLGSSLGSESGRKMYKDDYLMECNAMWSRIMPCGVGVRGRATKSRLGPQWKSFSGPPSRAGQLKVITLNQKD